MVWNRVRSAVALGCAVASLSAWPAAGPRQVEPTNITSITAAEFFTATKVWDAHLSLSEESWRAMQPRYGAGSGGFGFDRFLGPPGGRNGVAARQGVEFDYVPATLEIGGWRFPNVAARYKGNGSYLRARGTGKISIKVDLNKLVKGQKLAGLTTLNFQNNITDIGWMNEVLSYRLYRDAGALAPRTTYARVYVTVEGQSSRQYLGLYSVSENVDENFIEERFGTRKGAIFKPSTSSLFTYWGNDWNTYHQSYDPKTDLTEAEKQRIIELGTLVSSATDAEFASRIGEFVDLDSFATYFAVLVWIANADSLLQNGQNFYTYLHPSTNQMHFIAWDQDGSFGNFRSSGGSWAVHYPWAGTNLFLGRLYAVEAFRSRYLARMADLSDRLFLPDRFLAQVTEIGPAIRPSIALEGAQWLASFDQVASGQAGIVPYTRARAAFVRSELQRPN
jgi:hypothetical protein